VGFEKTLPGFNQHLPAKCSVFPLLFGAEHNQSLEIALISINDKRPLGKANIGVR
jgi:hypothetical protein